MSHNFDSCNFYSSQCKAARNAATSTFYTSTPASVAILRKLFIAERCRGAIAVPRHTIVNFSHQAQKGRRDGRRRSGRGEPDKRARGE